MPHRNYVHPFHHGSVPPVAMPTQHGTYEQLRRNQPRHLPPLQLPLHLVTLRFRIYNADMISCSNPISRLLIVLPLGMPKYMT